MREFEADEGINDLADPAEAPEESAFDVDAILDAAPDDFAQFDLPPEIPPEIQEIENIQGWLGDINPQYDPLDYTSPYNVNCGSCALAVWNRLNGGDATMIAGAENIPYNEQMEAFTGLQQVEMGTDEIRDYLLAQGAGANGIVGIDRVDGPGHWFNVYNDGERVVAIDGQNGSIADWPPQDLGDIARWELSIKKEDTQ